MASEWFPSETWNRSVERDFEARLSRARNKRQYLLAQACSLESSHPDVALRLLDRYFVFPPDHNLATAHSARATSLLPLGRVHEAVAAYEAALKREKIDPFIQTDADLELPYLIATRRMRDRYPRALRLLRGREGELTFPVDEFRWHAARALIAAEMKKPKSA